MKRLPFVVGLLLPLLLLRPTPAAAAAAAAAASASAEPAAADAAEPVTGTFVHQDAERTYYLYLPERTAYAPLIVVLHGYGGNVSNWKPGLIQSAAKNGYAVCIPQGLQDPTGKPSWNVGYPMQDGWEVDDVDFIMQLCRHLQEKYGFSTRNTFLTGISNGGEMCYLFAWKQPEFFAAIASMAGLTMEWLLRESDFTGPVPFMEVHGTADKTSLWDGDPQNTGGWGAYISVPVAVSNVAAKNRCALVEHTDLPLLHPDKPSRPVTLHRYYGGTDDTEVLFYEVKGGGHSWSLDDMDSYEAIMTFFESWRDRR